MRGDVGARCSAPTWSAGAASLLLLLSLFGREAPALLPGLRARCVGEGVGFVLRVAVILFPSRSVPLVSCCVLLPAYVSVEHFVVIGQGVQFRLSFFEHTFPVFILSLSPVPAGTAL